MGDGKKEDHKTIEVRGFHAATSSETFKNYFENPRKGGGEIIEFRQNDDQDIIYITFAEVGVAKGVIKKTHKIDNCDLQVKLYIPRPSYTDRLLITGIKDTTTKDCLINFLEAKSQCEIKDSSVVYGDKEGSAVIKFNQIPDLDQLQEACARRSLEGSKLAVSKVPISNIIIVQGLASMTSKDAVWNYFEGKRSGNVNGVSVENVHMKYEEGVCLVYFKNHAAIERIVDVSNGQKLEGSTLSVSICYECLYPTTVKDCHTTMSVTPSPLEDKTLHGNKLQESIASKDRHFSVTAEYADHNRNYPVTTGYKDLTTIKVDESKIKIMEVESAHFEAVKSCLIDKLFKQYTETTRLPSGIIQIKYHDLTTDKDHQTQELINEEIKLQNVTVDDQKITSVVKAVHNSTPELFCAHIPEQQIIVMFGEDRNKLEIAKRKIQVDLGQLKTRSRANRTFSSTARTMDSKQMSVIQHQLASNTSTTVEPLVRGKLLDVMVYKGDITRLSVDAIVNAANGQLGHGAGVARAIAVAAGDELEQEGNRYIKEHGQIPVSGVVVTTAGRLPYKKVIHAVGPEMYKYTHVTECLDVLCKTILRCLCEARKLNMTSVAFPAISSGIFGVPKPSCAQMYVIAVKSFNHIVDGGSLKEVHFVDVSYEMLQLIKNQFVSEWDKMLDEEVLKRYTKFINRCLVDVHGSPVSARSESSTTQFSASSYPHSDVAAPRRNPAQSTSSADAGIQIIVYKEDIFNVQCKAIVCWKDPGFTYTDHPIAQKIFDQAGKEYKKQLNEIKKKNPFPRGLVFMTDRENQHQPVIIHGVIDRFFPTFTDFKKLLPEILSQVHRNNLASFAIPVFNCLGFDSVKVFTETLCQAVKDFSKKNPKSTLKQILVVDLDQKVVDVCEIVTKSGVND